MSDETTVERIERDEWEFRVQLVTGEAFEFRTARFGGDGFVQLYDWKWLSGPYGGPWHIITA